jgi:hypothetical protein
MQWLPCHPLGHGWQQTVNEPPPGSFKAAVVIMVVGGGVVCILGCVSSSLCTMACHQSLESRAQEIFIWWGRALLHLSSTFPGASTDFWVVPPGRHRGEGTREGVASSSCSGAEVADTKSGSCHSVPNCPKATVAGLLHGRQALACESVIHAVSRSMHIYAWTHTGRQEWWRLWKRMQYTWAIPSEEN